MHTLMVRGNRSSPPSRHRLRPAALVLGGRAVLVLFVLAALGAAVAVPAHADPGPCGGTCPPPPPLVLEPPPPVTPVPPLVPEPPPPAPERKLVTVYLNTRAYSTPYFNALKSIPLRATSYVATCEANSGSRGRHSNPWWSRLQNGYWVNNGDLKGPARMGIGTCAPPRDDNRSVTPPSTGSTPPPPKGVGSVKRPSGKSKSPVIIARTWAVPHTRGLIKVRAFDVYFNKQHTRDIAAGEGVKWVCGLLLPLGPGGAAAAAICTGEIWSYTYVAGRAIDRKKCLKVRFPVPVTSVGTALPSKALPMFHGGKFCT
jgi:hypothetical protein